MPKREVPIFVLKCETRVHADAECEVQTHFSLEQHEAHVLQTHVLTPKHEVRILTTQREVHALQQTLPKREANTRVQPQMARTKSDPKSPHP